MKGQYQLIVAALLAQHVHAFPSMHLPVEKRQTSGSISGTYVPDPAQVLGVFNAEEQYISNTGEYAWVAPGPGDSRGPCPGLNAMANHGYLPHTGIGTIEQFVQGTNKVFGMGLDLGAFLAVLGASVDGDGLAWSIGGPNLLVPGGDGLIGSHNKYESDASPGRPDLYEYGNNYAVIPAQFAQLYNMQAGVSDADANYNLAVLEEFRSSRFEQSIQNNPFFFNGPFTGVGVQPAAYTFIYRFMANKSQEHPDGQLNRQVLLDFFGMTANSDGTFSGGTGQERIPDNWYTRSSVSPYTIPFFNADLNEEAMYAPKFLDVGGNTGKVNSFTGVDIDDLTGGIYNAATLTQGNNAFCLAYQFAQQGEPDLLKSLAAVAGGVGATALEALGCPQLQKVDTAMLEQFPGYTKAGSVL